MKKIFLLLVFFSVSCLSTNTDSETPFYCSHLENSVMCFVQTDMTYKSYKDIKPEIIKAREEFGTDKLKERNIEIVKEMLKENSSIDFIVKVTGLTIKEIKKIKLTHDLIFRFPFLPPQNLTITIY